MVSNFNVEMYVKKNLTRSQRSLYAELHSGTLLLVIETGRSNGLT